VPAPVATFFFLGYREQSSSVVLHHPGDPANSAIYEVMVLSRSEGSQPTSIPAGPTETESGRDGPSAGEALCPEVPRPALGLFVSGEAYLFADPVSGAECTPALDGAVPHLFQATADAIYYMVTEDGEYVVKRVDQKGEAFVLSFTAVGGDDAPPGYPSFAVSPDGTRIAWTAASAGPAGASSPTGTIRVANTDGSDISNPLSGFEAEIIDGRPRSLIPVRFSNDGSTLFFTLQAETGGIWSAFVGRYDSLFAIHLDGDSQPTEIFDCPGEYTRARMCIGDFYEVQGQVQALAYVEGQTLSITDGSGNVRNTIELEVDYLGYPTFGPGGELVFYSAEGTTSLAPDEGSIYHVAAPLVQPAAPEALVVDARLLAPRAWLDGRHVVTGYVSVDRTGSVEWGTAVVGLDGSIKAIAPESATDFVDVLPAPGGATAPSR
jgi:hypothetical protein